MTDTPTVRSSEDGSGQSANRSLADAENTHTPSTLAISPLPPSDGGPVGMWPPPPQAPPTGGPHLKSHFVPGPIFIGLTAVVMTLGVLASSESSFVAGFWLPALSVFAGLNIGLVWAIAFGLVALNTRLLVSRREWARWASPPAIFFFAVALMLSGVPGVARFELSRGQLDQAAASAQAGNRVGSGWIGLINVYDVRVFGDTTYFDTSTPASGEGCAFVKFAGSPSNWSPDAAWNPHTFGGGWWYGCTGMSSD